MNNREERGGIIPIHNGFDDLKDEALILTFDKFYVSIGSCGVRIISKRNTTKAYDLTYLNMYFQGLSVGLEEALEFELEAQLICPICRSVVDSKSDTCEECNANVHWPYKIVPKESLNETSISIDRAESTLKAKCYRCNYVWEKETNVCTRIDRCPNCDTPNDIDKAIDRAKDETIGQKEIKCSNCSSSYFLQENYIGVHTCPFCSNLEAIPFNPETLKPLDTTPKIPEIPKDILPEPVQVQCPFCKNTQNMSTNPQNVYPRDETCDHCKEHFKTEVGRKQLAITNKEAGEISCPTCSNTIVVFKDSPTKCKHCQTMLEFNGD